MKWLDGITDSMDMEGLDMLAVYGFSKSQTRLSD